MKKLINVPLVLVVFVLFVQLRGEDWTTYMKDNQRSGYTSEQLKFPLHQNWHYTSHIPPQPAWTEQEHDDGFHFPGIEPARIVYDRSNHVVYTSQMDAHPRLF